MTFVLFGCLSDYVPVTAVTEARATLDTDPSVLEVDVSLSVVEIHREGSFGVPFLGIHVHRISGFGVCSIIRGGCVAGIGRDPQFRSDVVSDSNGCDDCDCEDEFLCHFLKP